MKTLLKQTLGLLAVAVGLFAPNPVSAGPINGTIDFTGGLTVDTGNLNTATAFTSFTGVTVLGAVAPTGSYAGVPGGTAVPTMNAFTFTPVGSGVTPLWQFTLGATIYRFDLTSVTNVSQPGGGFLSVTGIGIAKITGFTDTPGTFSISTQSIGNGGPNFSFSSTTAVPDGGLTVSLLGGALVAVEALRRKFAMA